MHKHAGTRSIVEKSKVRQLLKKEGTVETA